MLDSRRFMVQACAYLCRHHLNELWRLRWILYKNQSSVFNTKPVVSLSTIMQSQWLATLTSSQCWVWQSQWRGVCYRPTCCSFNRLQQSQTLGLLLCRLHHYESSHSSVAGRWVRRPSSQSGCLVSGNRNRLLSTYLIVRWFSLMLSLSFCCSRIAVAVIL